MLEKFFHIVLTLMTIQTKLNAFNVNDLDLLRKQFLFAEHTIQLISNSYDLSQRKCFSNKSILNLSQQLYAQANWRINELIMNETDQYLHRVRYISSPTDLDNLVAKLIYYEQIRNDPNEYEKKFNKLELKLLKKSIEEFLNLTSDNKRLLDEIFNEKGFSQTTKNDFGYSSSLNEINMDLFNSNEIVLLIEHIDLFYRIFSNKDPRQSYSSFYVQSTTSKFEINKANQIALFEMYLDAATMLNTFITETKCQFNEQILNIITNYDDYNFNIESDQTKLHIYSMLKQANNMERNRTFSWLPLDLERKLSIEQLIYKTIETTRRRIDSLEVSLLVDYEFKHLQTKLNRVVFNELNNYMTRMTQIETRIDIHPIQKSSFEEKLKYFDKLISDPNRFTNGSLIEYEMSILRNDFDEFLRKAILAEKVQLVEAVAELDNFLNDLTKNEILRKVYGASSYKNWMKQYRVSYDYMLNFFAYLKQIYSNDGFNSSRFDTLTKRIDLFYDELEKDFGIYLKNDRNRLIELFNDYLEAVVLIYETFVKFPLFDSAIKAR